LPPPAHQPVQQQREAERDDHDGDHRRVLDRPYDDAFDRKAARERQREHDRERGPERQAVIHQRPADERRERRHLALREVDHARRAVDDHDRERQPCVDRALADAGGDLLRELGPGEGGDEHQ